VAIAILVAVNLRGVRQAGAIFSAPTYAFLLGMFVLIAVGLFDAFTRGFAPAPSVGLEPIEGLGVLLVLRAFSSGATAMTGIEAISNAVPAFQPPAARNARVVLTLMVGVLVTMFAALVVLLHLDGIVPQSDQTALSQLAHRSFGWGPLYAYVQGATALVLLLAANTAFNGFPRLLSVMARNGHAPRQFLRLGDRLAFSNGIIALALAAATLFVVFEGRTSALILDLSSLRALAYAASLGQPVLAVHISPDDDESARFKGYWAAWGDYIRLEVVDSPYRALVAPLACYIDALRQQRDDLTLTVVVPELIVKHRWHQLLHNGTARRLRRAVRRQPGVVITTVPVHVLT
jgi:amino acid transporter